MRWSGWNTGLRPSLPGGVTVDDLGRIWLMSSTVGRPGPNRPPSFWAIVGTDGVLLDMIDPPPALPALSDERLVWVSDDGVTAWGFTLHYRRGAIGRRPGRVISWWLRRMRTRSTGWTGRRETGPLRYHGRCLKFRSARASAPH
jgi:hypothetical protein